MSVSDRPIEAEKQYKYKQVRMLMVRGGVIEDNIFEAQVLVPLERLIVNCSAPPFLFQQIGK